MKQSSMDRVKLLRDYIKDHTTGICLIVDNTEIRIDGRTDLERFESIIDGALIEMGEAAIREFLSDRISLYNIREGLKHLLEHGKNKIS